MEVSKKDLELWKDEIKRANIVLYEKFRADIKIIGEGWQSIKEKNDAIFEEVGKISEKLTEMDLRLIKVEKDIEFIKIDIQFIKTDLKKFVREEEFSALEKRVIILENKFKRI
jgi:hypothetical protein